MMDFLLVTLLVGCAFALDDTRCPSPWPTPETARNRESCSCERTQQTGLMIRCSRLTYWPESAPADTKQLILDANPMPQTLESYFIPTLTPRLRVFSCRGCGFTTIKSWAFFGLHDIDTIHLEDNQITKIEKYSFAGLSNLKILGLENCGIVHIEKMAFYGLNHVDRFVLANNVLTDIEPDAFQNISQIDQMSFNHMEATELQPYSLRGIRDVNLLSFTHSNIRKLKPYSFLGINNITTINFHSSQLSTISPRAFVGIGKVSVIKFKSTQISTLKCDALVGVDCVRSIHWDDSPIRCDCHMQWLIEMRANISADLTKGLTCASPYTLSGQEIRELNRDSLQCNDEERFMGCASLDTRVPRVQPLERYIEEVMFRPKSSASLPQQDLLLIVYMYIVSAVFTFSSCSRL